MDGLIFLWHILRYDLIVTKCLDPQIPSYTVEYQSNLTQFQASLFCLCNIIQRVPTVQWVRGGHNLATEDKTENTK